MIHQQARVDMQNKVSQIQGSEREVVEDDRVNGAHGGGKADSGVVSPPRPAMLSFVLATLPKSHI